MDLPLNILFLCTGNSCRSIIGEGLANHLGQDQLHAISAGSHPTGQVNPGALAVLSRHGIEMANPQSQSMDDLQGEPVDLVISVCDAAAGEACPLWLGSAARLHWGLPDPAHVTGSEATIQAAFELTYRQLEQRLQALLALDLAALDKAALVAKGQALHQRISDEESS